MGMHERVRRNQERQRERETREHEEMHERIRREIARMELRDSINGEDEPVQAVVEIGDEVDEYFVVVAGGEREDRVEEIIRENDSDEEATSQIVLEVFGKDKTDGIKSSKAEEIEEKSHKKSDSGNENGTDGSDNEDLKETVSTL